MHLSHADGYVSLVPLSRILGMSLVFIMWAVCGNLWAEPSLAPPTSGAKARRQQAPSLSTVIDDAKHRAEREGKTLVIEFGASWCAPCKYFKKRIAIGEAVKRALEDIVFTSIECDNEATEAVCQSFFVTSYPTFLVLDSKGRELKRHTGLDGLNSPEEFARYLWHARDIGLSEEDMLARLIVDDPLSQIRAAKWYANHEREPQAAAHYERAATLDLDNALGVGADAAWKAMELSSGQTRVGAVRDAFLDYLERFPGTKPATDALVLVALSGAVSPASIAPILRRHSQGLSDAWQLEITAHLAIELGLIGDVVDLVAKIKSENPGRKVYELEAALALARGDAAAGRGYYVNCVADNVYGRDKSECTALGKAIEMGTRGPRLASLLRFARTYYVNLKTPGESGNAVRRRLLYEDHRAKYEHLSNRVRKSATKRGGAQGTVAKESRQEDTEQSESAEPGSALPYRALVFARHETQILERTMIGTRISVPWSSVKKKLEPTFILNAEVGRVKESSYAFDTSLMVGPSIRTGSAMLGIFSGVGGSGAGERLPLALHIPVEVALTIYHRDYEGDVWFRSRKLFNNSRRDGATNGPFDELAIGAGVQLFPKKAHGLMLGVLYEELQEASSATIWIGTRLTKPGGGW